MKESMQNILAQMSAGEIEVLDYGFRRPVNGLEVQFAIESDTRVFTTWIDTHEMAGAAFETDRVEDYSSFNVWTDYEKDVCMHVENWFKNVCDDREAFVVDCIRLQAKDATKSMASYARKCPDKFDFCNMNWMQKQAVFDLWGNRCMMPGAEWVKGVVSLIVENKSTVALPPEHWQFARLVREAIEAAKHPSPENANTAGRVFWLAFPEQQEYKITLIEKIAV